MATQDRRERRLPKCSPSTSLSTCTPRPSRACPPRTRSSGPTASCARFTADRYRFTAVCHGGGWAASVNPPPADLLGIGGARVRLFVRFPEPPSGPDWDGANEGEPQVQAERQAPDRKPPKYRCCSRLSTRRLMQETNERGLSPTLLPDAHQLDDRPEILSRRRQQPESVPRPPQEASAANDAEGDAARKRAGAPGQSELRRTQAHPPGTRPARPWT